MVEDTDEIVGVTFWSEIVEPLDISGTSYIKGYWIKVHCSDDFESSLQSMVFDGTNWLCYGDRRWVDFCGEPNAYMAVLGNNQKYFQTGFGVGAEDNYNYAYNQGIRSAIVTGPGLPETGILLEYNLSEKEFTIYPTDGGFYVIDDDSKLSAIPDNSEYTISLYLESAAQLYNNIETCTVLQTYKNTNVKPPVLNSDLNESLFVSLLQPASHNLSDLNFGSEIMVSWIKPANTSLGDVGLYWSNLSNQYWIDEDPLKDSTFVTLDTTGLPEPDEGWLILFISVEDEYQRGFNMGWSFY